MKAFYAYVRVSTVKQGEQGCSLDEQRASINAYAQKHGLTISEWFTETETAAKQGRREFARLTNLLRKGAASGVIIHKIDRGARNLKDWAGLGDLIDMGIDVRFAHEGLDLQTRGGRLAADIQAVVAADFIRNLREEVRKGFYGRLKQGFYPLSAPRGYLNHGRAKPKTINPIDGPLVAQAFGLYATGQHSLDTLRHELARRGLTQPNGKPLSFNGMSKLLRNSFYTGLIRIGTTGESFEGNHEPLVGKGIFDRVQQILSGRFYPRIEVHSFRYRRLVKCSQCGRSLTGERQKGHIYYRCHDRPCRGVSLSEGAIEAAVLQELAFMRLTGPELTDLRAMFNEAVLEARVDQSMITAQIRRDLGGLDVKLGRLTDALIDGLIDKPTHDGRKSELLERRLALRERLENEENCTFWQNVSQWFERGLDAYSGYILAGDNRKREAVQIFGSNLVAHGKNAVFKAQFPFDEIKTWTKAAACDPRRGAVRTLPSEARKPNRAAHDVIDTGLRPSSPHVLSKPHTDDVSPAPP